jgi:septal ring-binding cell division protein DamX
VVLLVAAGALVYAFLQISDNADQVAQAPAPATTPAAVPAASPSPAPSPSPTATASATATSVPGTTTTSGPTGPTGPTGPITTPTTTGSFASWPAGPTAYTVVLWSASTRAEAETKARELQSKGQSPGILHSDDYPSLRPGYWVVFSGQYPTRAQAQSAATAAQSAAPGAYARQVKPR